MYSEKQYKQPLISFIVPIYNAERTIERCVKSLVNQSYSNIEILLINNCSTDSCLQICKELSRKDSRIRFFDIAEKGVSVARNKGIDVACGEFISFLDADDWIDSNVCKVFAEQNSKNHYDLFCYSAKYHKNGYMTKSFLFANDVKRFSQEQKEELQIKVFAPQAPILSYKTETRFSGSACGKFYKRKILQQKHLRFSKETIISEDVLFNTFALDFFTTIGYSSKCFYHYEQQVDSAQNKYRPNSEKYFSFVILQIQDWLKKTRKNPHFVSAANCLFVHYLFGILKEDLYHKNNPASNTEKKRKLKKVLSKQEFWNSLKNSNKYYFSFCERTLIWLLQKKAYNTISFLFRFIR